MKLEELFEEVVKIQSIGDKTIAECIYEIDIVTKKMKSKLKATL